MSTGELTKAISISKATLYAHYLSKETLVRAALLGFMARIWNGSPIPAARPSKPSSRWSLIGAPTTHRV